MPDSGSLVGRFLVGFLATILIVIAALLIWLAITGWPLRSEIATMRSAAADARAAVATGDMKAAENALDAARDSVDSAAATLNSVPWTLAQGFPFVGATVQAAAVITDATDDVLSAANGLDGDLRNLTRTGDQRVATAMTALNAAAPQLSNVASIAVAAADDVSAINPDDIIGPVQDDVIDAQEQFADLADTSVELAGAAQVLPNMLGVDGPSKWTIILSQPAEARGTGGFFGAFVRVDVENGRFDLKRAAANNALRNDSWDISGMPQEYQDLWGTDASYLWGFNLTREYPYAAQVADGALRSENINSDYLISLDPRVVAGLLTLTGPVTADGVTITAANAERFFTRDIYVQFPDSAEKDAVTLSLLTALFDSLNKTRYDLVSLMRALADPIGEGRLLVWSADKAEQGVLVGMQIGGSLAQSPPSSVTVALNNSAGNKIDSFVDSSVTYSVSGQCSAGTVQGEVRVRLKMRKVPKDMPPYIAGRNDVEEYEYGSTSMLVHIYGPRGSVWTGYRIDGEPAPLAEGREMDRPVWWSKVQLPAGGDVEIAVTFGQDNVDAQPTVITQPMVNDTLVRTFDSRSCA